MLFLSHITVMKNIRPRAIPPKIYHVNDYTMLYPKDIRGGGSWIAVNENGNAAVLLNGGFVKHTSTPPYRKSRGLVFLEIAASGDMFLNWQMIDLNNIEPFTLILWNNSSLIETRWDGNQKHSKQLNSKNNHIWSSTTLFDTKAHTKRKKWFKEWQRHHPSPSLAEIMHFHRYGGEKDTCNDLCINRDGNLLTFSITGIKLTSSKGAMKYLDLQDDLIHEQEIQFIQDRVEK